MSDVFASFSWAADHLFSLLAAGVSGVDFHGDPFTGTDRDYYSPIKIEGRSYKIRPTYFGMLFFKQAAQGRLIPLSYSPQPKMRFYAFQPDANSLHVVGINLGPNETSIQLEPTIAV